MPYVRKFRKYSVRRPYGNTPRYRGVVPKKYRKPKKSMYGKRRPVYGVRKPYSGRVAYKKSVKR